MIGCNVVSEKFTVVQEISDNVPQTLHCAKKYILMNQTP
ncbi:hypothetical protein BLL52_3875 [Rhodoferax antarcticus ANT.BR]|uniref:Uncharacterized protein n=1 Tax=Rhodoferax antarcticus ANT.BR TaxID=1111071 RepID=A0A1Q8YAL8_9BURK|nr:hypothetical protein BLL52_3875 [Rhodoferax antarcticus ANT.BR]